MPGFHWVLMTEHNPQVVDTGVLGVSGLNTESPIVDHSGYHVWRELRSLHVKDLFCRIRN